MLSAAKPDHRRLLDVLFSAQRHIHSSSHLFNLARDAFRYADTETDHSNRTLVRVAFQLGMDVMRMTLTCLNWRRRDMVRWFVTCTIEFGFDGRKILLENWSQFFTPTEAAGIVATAIMSQATRHVLNISVCIYYGCCF